jgi:heterotetrameric sarcosine oxidase gamma subunit
VDDPGGKAFAVQVEGLCIMAIDDPQVASLRYFDHAGSFAGALAAALGQPLPSPQGAIRLDAGNLLLWRSPTETLFYGLEAQVLAELDARLAGAIDGCLVDQSGGICVFRVAGGRAEETLRRLGAVTAIPGPGEARSGRLAEVQVLTACVRAEEFLLFVERVYAPHLAEWLRTTAADLQ